MIKIVFLIFSISVICLNELSLDIFAEKVEVDSLNTYQIQKLKQEIEQLKHDNSLNPIVRNLPTYAGVLTALVAVVGAFISFLKYLKEKHNETEQKKLENKICLEAKFDSVINNLGSSSHSIQASAAVSLLTFLRPEYKDFHKQVYLILLANLKTDLPQNINALLVRAFERAIRLNIDNLQAHKSDNVNDGNSNFELDLSRANLYRIDLHGLDLENVDFAFSNLQQANFVNCNLRRAKGFMADLSCSRLTDSNMTEGRFNQANFENAQFNRATLISTKMKNTNLKGAEFYQAKLQEANLDESDFTGAKFEYANLNNTFFRKIKCSELDLKSILKAKDDSWKKANFDQEIRLKLNQLNSNKKESNPNAHGNPNAWLLL